jgi:hypothetical protein
MSTKTVKNYLAEKIDWKRTTDAHHPFTAEFEGEKCVIRLNDFPEEHLYTLIVDGKEVADFDDWSATWTRAAEKNIAPLQTPTRRRRSYPRRVRNV